MRKKKKTEEILERQKTPREAGMERIRKLKADIHRKEREAEIKARLEYAKYLTDCREQKEIDALM